MDEKEYLKQLEEELSSWDKLIHKKAKGGIEEKETGDLSYEDMMALLLRPCKTKDELRNWIKVFLHIDLPDTTVDPQSNSNPLQMVWGLYETAIYYDNIEPAKRLIKSLYYCTRGGFKTMCCCIVELLMLLHTDRDMVHVGLIESQAKTAYNEYLRPFLDKPYIKEVKINSILEKSSVKNKDGEITKIQVIPCTMNKTSSPRAQLVAKDEVDKTKGEQVQAYNNIAGMLTMTNDGKFAMEFDISSRDSAYGMVQHVIDNSDKTGTKIYHWNRIDITQACPDERSGTEPIEIYIKRDTLIAISKDEWLSKDLVERNNWEKNWGLEGCLKNCKMFGACKGYLKNQNSKCKWLKPVEETENAILTAPSEDMAIAQLLCRKPPKTGLVYGDFEVNHNVKTAAEMYEMFSGEKHNNPNLSTQELIEIFNEYSIPCYLGADAGFHNPAALLIYIDRNENIYVLKEYMPNNIDTPDLVQYLYDNWAKYYPRRAFPDSASPDLASALKKKSFTVSEKVDKKVQPGIATVKGFLRPPATQKTKLFIHTDCVGLRTEFGKYAYKQRPDGSYADDPLEKFDHALDALRYILHTLFGKPGANLGYEDDIVQKKIFKDHDEYNKHQMSPASVAKKQGFQVNDNKHILDELDEDGNKKPKKSTTKFDMDDF